jgi:hypothetical protein
MHWWATSCCYYPEGPERVLCGIRSCDQTRLLLVGYEELVLAQVGATNIFKHTVRPVWHSFYSLENICSSSSYSYLYNKCKEGVHNRVCMASKDDELFSNTIDQGKKLPSIITGKRDETL